MLNKNMHKSRNFIAGVENDPQIFMSTNIQNILSSIAELKNNFFIGLET